jgi:hypothetical protein
MNFAAQVSNFTDHQQQVMPHAPGDLLPFRFRLLGKRKLQILLDDATADFENIRGEKCQPLTDGIARLDSHRLNQRQRYADGEVLGEVAYPKQHLASRMTNDK